MKLEMNSPNSVPNAGAIPSGAMLRAGVARLGFTLTKRIPANERRMSALRGEDLPVYLIPERHQTFSSAVAVAEYVRIQEMLRA